MENESICITAYNGTRRWYLNGQYHREDGPAIEYSDGSKVWYLNGRFHRVGGPAIIRKNGETEWWINGNRVTHEITKWAEENDIALDNLTEVDKALIKLVWADYDEK